MIIFDLDGTLADCEHRRHFIDPIKAGCIEWINLGTGKKHFGHRYEDKIFHHWEPDWKSFYEACDKDKPITPVIEILDGIYQNTTNFFETVEIWSGRCESVREKTTRWLEENILWDGLGSEIKLKMRPIGDHSPDDHLKEMWLLDEFLLNGKKIDFVFDGNPKVISMWKRRGIFVFDVNQTGEEF